MASHELRRAPLGKSACKRSGIDPDAPLVGSGVMVHAKPHLPTKDCAVCGRPFAWRKKWERDWANVRFCSDRCRARSKSAGKGKEAPDRA